MQRSDLKDLLQNPGFGLSDKLLAPAASFWLQYAFYSRDMQPTGLLEHPSGTSTLHAGLFQLGGPLRCMILPQPLE